MNKAEATLLQRVLLAASSDPRFTAPQPARGCDVVAYLAAIERVLEQENV